MKKIDLKLAVQAKSEQQTITNMTLTELVNAYCAHTLSADPYTFKKWLDAFGNDCAWSIDALHLDIAGEAMIEAGYANATVNRNFSLLGQAYRWAKKKRLTPKGFISPTLHLTRYEEAIREVKLTDAQLKRVLDASLVVRDRRFTVLIRLLAESGARLSEVAERRWCDISLERKEIIVERTKTGVPRVLHFTEETAALMSRVWPERLPNVMLFGSIRAPSKPTNYRKSWKKITEAAGVPDLRQHDLRHHRAKQLLTAGVTIGVASQALGHSSLILQRRYGHLESKTTRQALESSWS